MKLRLEQLLKEALQNLGWPSTPIQLEIPKQKEHGDLAANLAMLLAKPLHKSPREIAAQLIQALQPFPVWLEKVEIAGPGFINFTLARGAYFDALAEIAKAGKKYGSSKAGKGQKVILEYVSANPTGPLNVVSARAAAVGDTLANILKACGYKVHREFYVNDVGNQIDLFATSLEARCRQTSGEAAALPEEGYRGEYLKALAEGLVRKRQKWTPAALRREGLRSMIAGQKRSLKKFGVVFDRWFHQSELMRAPLFAKTLKKLEEAGHLYEQEGALFFRSTAFGDDKDRVVRKQNGDYSYFAADAVYHAGKFRRKFDRAVDFFGPDHHGTIARIKAAVAALGLDPSRLTVLLIQQVNLLRKGEVVKMSKRAGEMITMDDLIEDVGKDAARYFFLLRSPHSHLDFDLDLAKKQTPENPVFYIQYAHARIASIFRKAQQYGIPFKQKAVRRDTAVRKDIAVRKDGFDLPEEKELAKKLLEYPEVIARAAQELEPHGLAFYCLDLARQFQAYYSSAKEDPRYRVVDPQNPARTQTKLYLLKNIQIVLQNALRLMGISAPDRMESKEDASGSL